jgi:2-dehydro-3-deoxyphosphogalactonate aldolase
MVGTGGLKALKSVLPAGTELWPVGGITPESMRVWVAAGATGFGIGSQLFNGNSSVSEVARNAAQFVGAWRAI